MSTMTREEEDRMLPCVEWKQDRSPPVSFRFHADIIDSVCHMSITPHPDRGNSRLWLSWMDGINVESLDLEECKAMLLDKLLPKLEHDLEILRNLRDQLANNQPKEKNHESHD